MMNSTRALFSPTKHSCQSISPALEPAFIGGVPSSTTSRRQSDDTRTTSGRDVDRHGRITGASQGAKLAAQMDQEARKRN
jgi:hypothetical protein